MNYERENIMGQYSIEIWDGVEDPAEFCGKNKPISGLVVGVPTQPFNWLKICKVTPGITFYDSDLRVGLENIWGSELLKRDMFLDIGCGPNALTSTQGRYVYGIDPQLDNPVLPERAMKAVVEDLPFKSETFDGVFADRTIGFFPNYFEYWQGLKEMLRVLKIGRTMIIRTGQNMTKKLYQETQKRFNNIGHQTTFPHVSSCFVVFKVNENISL